MCLVNMVIIHGGWHIGMYVHGTHCEDNITFPPLDFPMAVEDGRWSEFEEEPKIITQNKGSGWVGKRDNTLSGVQQTSEKPLAACGP